MFKRCIGVGSLAILVACGGGDGSNPITGGLGGNDQPIDPADPNVVDGLKFAFNQDDGLVMNALTYDAAADELFINNIPFDTTTGIYERTRDLPNGWGLYENDESGMSGRIPYFAVFEVSATGDTQAAAVASGGFIGDGNVGATAQRTNGSVALPVTGILNYNGTYAGVRELGETVPGGPSAELVQGDAIVNIDFDDFDITGDIVGFVINREVYTTAGVFVGNLAAISLAEAFIDRPTATIDSSAAIAQDGTLNGSWEGVFGGPNGEEIAAYLVVSGTTPLEVDGVSGAEETVREIGALLVAQ